MYIDPNTGGILFQALAAFFAIFSGLLFAFSSQIRAGIAKLRRKNREETETTEEQNNE